MPDSGRRLTGRKVRKLELSSRPLLARLGPFEPIRCPVNQRTSPGSAMGGTSMLGRGCKADLGEPLGAMRAIWLVGTSASGVLVWKAAARVHLGPQCPPRRILGCYEAGG